MKILSDLIGVLVMALIQPVIDLLDALGTALRK